VRGGWATRVMPPRLMASLDAALGVIVTRLEGRLGILVGGGPAPGINSVISAATIEARNSGLGVLGIYDGFEHLIEGRTDRVRELTIEDVSRIHFQGGSILRTSRANPTKDVQLLERVVGVLRDLGINYLVTIGGDDTAFAAASVAAQAAGAIRVAHVPKTIDNDLPLARGMPTFGFESAREAGTQLTLTIMEDSRTTNRWYLVVVMGRKAGHLALGIGKSAGATLTIVPEEFSQNRISLDDISRVIEGAILKRRINGQSYGVAVVAEGVGEKIDPEELRAISGLDLSYDPYGHVALAEIPLSTLIKQRVQNRFAQRGEKIHVTDVNLGYELRCVQPNPYDIDYTRTLGNGAVRFLLGSNDGHLANGGFVSLNGVDLDVLPFEDLRDPETGRTRIRIVDVNSEHYRVARDYMIRLNPEDLENDQMCRRLAEVANLSPDGFREEFSKLWQEASLNA
ncbi:MAG TPA: diphosphate--fructose-6-phosphate 1-phosphotransferase, partial [Dehalococcoidia bacterium]|nr:diphosphate--fructose-6-phosphate 1-phosphotransferase [Dehalococcoidia bacterium]